MGKLGKIMLLLAGISLASFAIVLFILGGWVPFLWIPVGFFVVFLIWGLYYEKNNLVEVLTMRTTKTGMNNGLLVLLVLVGLIAANFIGVRHYKAFDFSGADINTLSEQSIKLIKGLTEDLKVTMFYQKGSREAEEMKRAFRELLKRYQDQSAFVKLDFVEVNERPDLAEQYGVNKGSGVVFVDYKGHRNRIDKIEEQEITSALVKVTREKDKTLYFVTGHGEPDFENAQDPAGMSRLKEILEGNRYQVKTVSLVSVPEVPKDADILAVIGPKQNFLDGEVKILEDYLKRGGSLIIGLDPKVNHHLDSVVEKMGVKLQNNFILTVMNTIMGKVIDPSQTAAKEFSTTHEITKVFKNQYVVFKMPQALKKVEGNTNTTEDIVKSDDQAVSYESNSFQGKPGQGPFTLAMAIKGKWTQDAPQDFNAVVIGNSHLFTNQYLFQNLNRDLILNSAAFLAKEENLISITPKEVKATPINMTDTQFWVFIWGVIIPVPLALIGISIILWFRRRYA